MTETVTEEMLKKPREFTVLGVEITPAKVVATYLAFQPIIADALGVWDKLRPLQQDVLLIGSVLGALIYMVLYGIYVSKRKVAQLNLEANSSMALIAKAKK